MKNKRKILFLLFFFIGFIAMTIAADPPPIDGDPTSGGGTPIGGSAPLDMNYWYTLFLAIIYGVYSYFKKNINFKLLNDEK